MTILSGSHVSFPVNEIFETFQGEAHWTGTPAIFVRLQGCDVGCPWCDTKHTWALNPANEIQPYQMVGKLEDAPTYARMMEWDLFDLIRPMPSGHVVFTGGEPAYHDLTNLSAALIDTGKTVQLETSGTHEIRIDRRAWVTVSPKVGMPGGFEVRAAALLRANEIKFPIGKPTDINALQDLLGIGIRPDADVWLQPLSQNKRATELCMIAARNHGWRVSLQTHKFLGVR